MTIYRSVLGHLIEGVLLSQPALEPGVLLLQLLGTFGRLGVLLGPVLVQPAVPGRLSDLELLDETSTIGRLLALPDFGDGLLGVWMRAIMPPAPGCP